MIIPINHMIKSIRPLAIEDDTSYTITLCSYCISGAHALQEVWFFVIKVYALCAILPILFLQQILVKVSSFLSYSPPPIILAIFFPLIPIHLYVKMVKVFVDYLIGVVDGLDRSIEDSIQPIFEVIDDFGMEVEKKIYKYSKS